MYENDPEKRIADLERQVAELRAAGEGRLTPEQVRNVAFSKPPLGQRGYNEDEVDAFLDRVEAALQDPTGRMLTPEQVRTVAFAKPPLGKRGYNEDEVDTFLDRVEAALAGPRESNTFGMRASEESAASGEPIRCLLRSYPSSFRTRQPPLVIDVSRDAIWVSDSNTNALIASAGLAQVTAIPAERTNYRDSDGGFFGRSYTRPLLVVRVPGLQPLIITTPAMNASPTQYRLSWRGTVGKAKKPGHLVTEAEFRTLVGKFGLAPYLEDRTNRA